MLAWLSSSSTERKEILLEIMSTQEETIEFILEKLGHRERFRARAMFGEYALYADDKVVALVCDDQLYIKITPESSLLEGRCDKDAPYRGAKPHYLVEEAELSKITNLPKMLLAIAKSLPLPKKKKKKISK